MSSLYLDKLSVVHTGNKEHLPCGIVLSFVVLPGNKFIPRRVWTIFTTCIVFALVRSPSAVFEGERTAIILIEIIPFSGSKGHSGWLWAWSIMNRLQ